MPSMPGAHNVKPVMAHSLGRGIYHVMLELEMYGEWVIKMDFTEPLRDRITKKMFFGKNGQITQQQGLPTDYALIQSALLTSRLV